MQEERKRLRAKRERKGYIHEKKKRKGIMIITITIKGIGKRNYPSTLTNTLRLARPPADARALSLSSIRGKIGRFHLVIGGPDRWFQTRQISLLSPASNCDRVKKMENEGIVSFHSNPFQLHSNTWRREFGPYCELIGWGRIGEKERKTW